MTEAPPSSGRAKVAALLLLACLMAAGLWLAHRLSGAAAIQDCVSTGRRDCGS
jgi:hypothetical protein